MVPMAPSQRSGPAARRVRRGEGMALLPPLILPSPQRGEGDLRGLLAECQENARHDLVGVDAGGVDGKVGLAIVGLAGAIQGLDLLATAAGEHRSLARAPRALVECVEVP